MKVIATTVGAMALGLACGWLPAAELVEGPTTVDNEAAVTDADKAALADSHPTIRDARRLAAVGRDNEAMQLLQTYLIAFPEDHQAAIMLKRLQIAARKAEMDVLVQELVKEKDFILPDPGYARAKGRSELMITRQLDIVEHLIHAERHTQAIEALENILSTHPENEATLILMERTLAFLVKKEQKHLDTVRNIRQGEIFNEVLAESIFPRRGAPIARPVFIYPEDIAEEERRKVREQLNLRVKLMRYDAQPVGEVLRQVFAVAGLNFIILDSAIVDETVSLDLVDESVEHILEIIQRMVPLQFNYRGGSVYITNGDNVVMTTEIIRLRYGLSNVLKPADIPQLGGGGGGGGGEGGGGGGMEALVQAAGGGGGDAELTDLERFLEEALGDEGLVDWPEGSKYYLDKKMNTLVVRSSPAAIAEIKRLLQFIDRPAQQVLIEAKFVEVRADAMKEVGVDWAIIGRKEQNSAGTDNIFFGGGVGNTANPLEAATNPAFAAGYANSISNAGSGFLAGIVGAGDGMLPNFSAQLRLMQERGDANLLTEPKILTLNNGTGIIDIRQDIAFIEDFEQRSGNGNNTITDTSGENVVTSTSNVLVPRFGKEEEGIMLMVQPSIALNSDMVTLHVTPTVREFIGFAGGGEQTLGGDTSVLGSGQVSEPQFATRRLFTSLNVKNGQTVVLGGLSREVDQDSNAGIPGLQNVPGLGRLFRRDSSNLRRSKLMVFLTVQMIDPTGKVYAEEVRHLNDSVRVALPSDLKEEARERVQAAAKAAAQRAAEREAQVTVEPTGTSPVQKQGGRR